MEFLMKGFNVPSDKIMPNSTTGAPPEMGCLSGALPVIWGIIYPAYPFKPAGSTSGGSRVILYRKGIRGSWHLSCNRYMSIYQGSAARHYAVLQIQLFNSIKLSEDEQTGIERKME